MLLATGTLVLCLCATDPSSLHGTVTRDQRGGGGEREDGTMVGLVMEKTAVIMVSQSLLILYPMPKPFQNYTRVFLLLFFKTARGVGQGNWGSKTD